MADNMKTTLLVLILIGGIVHLGSGLGYYWLSWAGLFAKWVFLAAGIGSIWYALKELM